MTSLNLAASSFLASTSALASVPVSTSASSAASRRRPSSNGNSIKNGGSRSHVCSTCNMSFNRLLHLQRHEYRHGDSRPFVCSQCPKSFTRQDSLVRHARLHTRGQGPSKKLELPKKNIKACMKCTEHIKCERCSAVGKRAKKASSVEASSPESTTSEQQQRSPSLVSLAPSDFSWTSSSPHIPSLIPSGAGGEQAASPTNSNWSSCASSDGLESDLHTPATGSFPWRTENRQMTASNPFVIEIPAQNFQRFPAVPLLSPFSEVSPTMGVNQAMHLAALHTPMVVKAEQPSGMLPTVSTAAPQEWPIAEPMSAAPTQTSTTAAFCGTEPTLGDFQWSSSFLDLGGIDGNSFLEVPHGPSDVFAMDVAATAFQTAMV